jgi:integrase
MLYKRGNVWWYEFSLNGARIRESSHTTSKTIAKQAELQRRRELELSINGLTKRERPALFPVAAKQWLGAKTALSPLGLRYYRQYITKLSHHFGNRFICDITANDVATLQVKRQGEGLSGRQINAEVGTLRAILRYYGLWAHFSGRVTMLRQQSDVGKALAKEDEETLLEAITQSRSPALYPFFVLSLDAGLRPSEIRCLRRCDLNLVLEEGTAVESELVVRRSKTEAGTGRIVPLTRRVCAALATWLSRLPNLGPDSYVFPFHHVALAGNARKPLVYGVELSRPMSPSSYRTAFETARTRAGVRCRFYDARHTFVTRLAENPAVAEETIRQLAGHISPRMLARYAHIRVQARRAAIATLEPRCEPASSEGDSPQNPPQSPDDGETASHRKPEKNLNFKDKMVGSPGRIRTSDLTVNSRPLYRLSYRGAFGTLFGIDLAA